MLIELRGSSRFLIRGLILILSRPRKSIKNVLISQYNFQVFRNISQTRNSKRKFFPNGWWNCSVRWPKPGTWPSFLSAPKAKQRTCKRRTPFNFRKSASFGNLAGPDLIYNPLGYCYFSSIHLRRSIACLGRCVPTTWSPSFFSGPRNLNASINHTDTSGSSPVHLKGPPPPPRGQYTWFWRWIGLESITIYDLIRRKNAPFWPFGSLAADDDACLQSPGTWIDSIVPRECSEDFSFNSLAAMIHNFSAEWLLDYSAGRAED